MTPQEALQRTIEHREIFHDEMMDLIRQIMRGDVSPVMTAAILTGLRVKKETVGEISAAAQVMRELSRPVKVAGTVTLKRVLPPLTAGTSTAFTTRCPPSAPPG